jgi:hypothetical protein
MYSNVERFIRSILTRPIESNLHYMKPVQPILRAEPMILSLHAELSIFPIKSAVSLEVFLTSSLMPPLLDVLKS